jgi:hypothetical protein
MVMSMVIPLLCFRLVWGCVGTRLRKILPAVGLITRCRRRLRLAIRKNYRRCAAFGIVGQVLWFSTVFAGLYFFSQ